ncbi:MAG: 16S rRNA (cytosine(1402)-N(4))-methyltransferase RsmH [Candidatus Shapirobacteria bacterium]
MKDGEKIHRPVLLKKAVEVLKVKKEEVFIDATIGGAGHGEEILKKGGKLIGLDLDQEMLSHARARLKKACPNGPWKLYQTNFSNLSQIVKKHKLPFPAGILFDLGLSNFHYKQANRGFSFQDDSVLDMRISKSGPGAWDLLKGVSEEELAEVLRLYGQEPLAKEIAREIIFIRKKGKLTGVELARLVKEVYHRYSQKKLRTQPATRTFLALRIWVNNELLNLKMGLAQALEILKPKGRIVVISFHSGEDRIVKNTFKKWEKEKRGEVLTKKPIFPDPKEVKENYMARSAVLRAFGKK